MDGLNNSHKLYTTRHYTSFTEMFYYYCLNDSMQSALNIWRLNVVLKYVNAECSVGKQTPSPEQYSLERLVRKHDQH